MGNICRSPAGENVFRHFVESKGLQDVIEIDSAGTIGFHTGKLPDARMRKALARRNYPTGGAARQVVRADIQNFDLILTMDDDNLRNVREYVKDDSESAKVKRFVDYCERFEDKEVPDPYYGGNGGFEHVLDLLEDGCESLLEEIQQKL
ncbi:low molecular weight protein-tyrosine-phosphatase [Persicirhabdus sediminis]|nr:low molecular weight protein-tyrosine-phosphatase [Persicirhabdus sediminis]